MRNMLRSAGWVVLAATLALPSCSSGNGNGGPGGGSAAGGTGGGTDGASVPAGGTGGLGVAGGSSQPATGSATGTGGRAGGADGSGGVTAVARTGGATGTAGAGARDGGASPTDGSTSATEAGDIAAGGGGVASGGATGATGGSGGAATTTTSVVPSGDAFVSDVKVAVHANTATILVVTWTQLELADSTLLEFSVGGGSPVTSRPQTGTIGGHRDVVLGVPEKTAVTVRIISRLGGIDYKTKDYQGTTGALPSGLPKPTLLAYDATAASPERWLLGAVENSPGGCANPSCYYISTFWIYIMDRQGRMVWYWADPSDNASSAYPRIARDGEYLVIDRGRQGNTGVLRMTLDRWYYELTAIKGLADAMDVTTDGSVLYDVRGDLKELTRAGTTRSLWSCRQAFPSFEKCYSNTVNWNAAADTVMLAFPDDGTVVEIDRKTGTMVGQYGNAPGSYAFSPSSWQFQYPHSPNLTPQGTLILSTHLPAYPFGTAAAPQHHAFAEFEIDRAAKRLTEKWVYGDGSEWAMFKGFAIRLANGNTLGNYGTGGAIREVTPDKKTVFHVSFPVTPGDGYNNKMLGNNVLLDDLYALNGGGPK